MPRELSHGLPGRTVLVAVLIGLGLGAAASAQRGLGAWGRTDAPYDGRLSFVRLRWTDGDYGAPPRGMGHNFWLHEFPGAEQNLMAVVGDFTIIDARTDGSLVLTLDDPALFQHPVVTMWEPGFWVMTDDQARRLREYLLKGGFVIFNDFEGPQWENFEAQMRRVLPEGRWIRLTEDHPIFDAFFRLDDIHAPNPMNHHLRGLRPEYFGLFEDNDAAGRLMAIANYNTNLGEYWMGAGSGYFGPDWMSRSFGLGVNYFVHAMTH